MFAPPNDFLASKPANCKPASTLDSFWQAPVIELAYQGLHRRGSPRSIDRFGKTGTRLLSRKGPDQRVPGSTFGGPWHPLIRKYLWSSLARRAVTMSDL